MGLGYRFKYIYNGNRYKIMPKKTDTVVEAGVYKGYDTAIFAKLANRVLGFEPSPRNFKKAQENLRSFRNVKMINSGLWNSQKEMKICYGEKSEDDGFLEPDQDSGRTGRKIQVDTLKGHLSSIGVDNVDFLKIEAEGAEVEVIEGLNGLRPRSIVVNAGEERGGEPTGKDVVSLLKQMGYSLVGLKMGHVLFFTSKKIDDCALF